MATVQPSTVLPIPIVEAALMGEVSEVVNWLDAGGNVNAREEAASSTLLMAAAHVGDMGLVQMLITRKANLNLETDDGQTALGVAVKRSPNDAIAMHLMTLGARLPKGRAPPTAGNEPPGVSAYVIGAAMAGTGEEVAGWLDEGGHVDAQCPEAGYTSLLKAAALAGQESIVHMLLQRSATIDLADSDGVTALMAAACGGPPESPTIPEHAAVVKLLLRSKANASLCNYQGQTALSLAEECRRDAVAQLLRDHLSTPNADASSAQADTPMPFEKNATVSLAGLQGRADLNGEQGTLLQWVADKGRWAVKMNGSGESLLVKTENLVGGTGTQS